MEHHRSKEGQIMIIEPIIRRNICINAHPLGCAAQVRAQINYVMDREKIVGPKKVLVIGASNGLALQPELSQPSHPMPQPLASASKSPQRQSEPAQPVGTTSKPSGRKLTRRGCRPGMSMAMRFRMKRNPTSWTLSRPSWMRLIF